MAESVFLFWDNSNIFIPAQYVANRREGYQVENSIRIEFENLYRLAVAGRPTERAFCVGSIPPELKAVWDKIRRTGVQLELYERGKDTGKEQGVDQCLQVHLLRAGMDSKAQIAVLLTGDGKGYADGIGYHALSAFINTVGESRFSHGRYRATRSYAPGPKRMGSSWNSIITTTRSHLCNRGEGRNPFR